MNLAPKDKGEPALPLGSRLPASLEEAVKYVESKFPFIADSTQTYEEYEGPEGSLRAINVTYAMGVKIDGQKTIEGLIHGWLFCMMDHVSNSKRQRLYWRKKPIISVEHRDFPDGPAFAAEIISRSSMV